MTFVRADLPIWRRIDLECKNLETLCFELNMNKRKGGGILCTYRPPSTLDTVFDKDTSLPLDKMLLNFDHVFDTLTPSKSKPLKHILETFCMTNLVNKPTCYTKNGNPSCIGVILTNPPKLFCNTTVINCLVVSSLYLLLATYQQK